MVNLSIGFCGIQCESINKCDDDVGKVNLLAIFLLICKRMKQQNITIGFLLGQGDVIQKLSMDPNILNSGNMY